MFVWSPCSCAGFLQGLQFLLPLTLFSAAYLMKEIISRVNALNEG